MITIACLCDTHAAVPSLEEKEGMTAWFHAGDIYNRGSINPYNRGDIKPPSPSMIAVSNWVKTRKAPVYIVNGNHDCNDNAKVISSCKNVTATCEEVSNGLWVVGLGWTGGRFCDLPTNRNMAAVCAEAMNVVVRKTPLRAKFILLTHYAPWFPRLFQISSSIEGWAFESISAVAREIKPVAIVFGHIHEFLGKGFPYSESVLSEDGKLLSFKTLLVCPGPEGGYLNIDLEAATASFDFAKPKS